MKYIIRTDITLMLQNIAYHLKHSQPVLLAINAQKMCRTGAKFVYKSSEQLNKYSNSKYPDNLLSVYLLL